MIFLSWLLQSCAIRFLRRGIAVTLLFSLIGFAQLAYAQEAEPQEAEESDSRLPTAEDVAKVAGQMPCPTPCHLRHENQIPKGYKKEPAKADSQSWSSGGKASPSKPAGPTGGKAPATNKPSGNSSSGQGNGGAAQPGAAKPPATTAKPPTIRNSHLAGKKHPATGVPFDKDGYPDFRAAGVVKKEVKIKMKGTNQDFAEADKAANFTTRPEGYTWHHHQDGTTMQLVPTTIHQQTGHTGGAAVIRRGQ